MRAEAVRVVFVGHGLHLPDVQLAGLGRHQHLHELIALVGLLSERRPSRERQSDKDWN
jgi:hypothetical protein